jgi:lipopolysaccharide/colanic/teichoic acid biosynthesis glycosyltransferase
MNLVSKQPDSRLNKKLYTILKRLVDVFLACFLLSLLAPVVIVISVVLWVMHKGASPLYLQDRALVLEKSVFRIYKFKTITTLGAPVASTKEVFIKRSNSVAINGFCSLLRKTGLDELPQIINVLKGDMSFVGPRPFSLTDLELIKVEFPELYAQRLILNSKPGMTGLWQIFGDRDAGVENLVQMDLAYEQSCSALLDIKLILNTVPVVLFAGHSDAYLGKNFQKKPYRQENMSKKSLSAEILPSVKSV